MNKIYEQAFDRLIKHEGKYSNHKNDYGGETMYGWTEKRLKEIGYDRDIKDFSLKDAKRLYHKYYWLNPGINQIKNRYIAIEVFEQGVNMGPGEAIKRLQKAYNLLTGDNIAEDGIIGAETLQAVNTYKYPNAIYNELNILQGEKYNKLVKKDESQRTFL